MRERIKLRLVWLVLYWPRLSWWEFNRRLFWARAAEQQRVARKLEWRIKQL